MELVTFVLCWLAQSAMASTNDIVAKLLSNRSFVDNGKSLTNSSPESVIRSRKSGYSPRCLINVENWTLWKLQDPQSHSECGYVDIGYDAVVVEPGTREVMLAYKAVGSMDSVALTF